MKKRLLVILLILTLLVPCGCSFSGNKLHVPKEYTASKLDDITYGFETCEEAVSGTDYIALKVGARYGFNGLRAFEYDYNDAKFTAIILSGSVYAPCRGLAEAIDFEYDEENVTFKKDSISFTVSNKEDIVTCGKIKKAFHKAVKIDGKHFIDVRDFAKMFGFTYEYDESKQIALMKNTDSKASLNEACERFDFYENTVYTTEKVECDTTGKGKFKSSKEKDRLVGVAYSTWFYEGRRWGGRSTWNMPLIGAYSSFDRNVIRRHGEWLRDAGVDFVFVDWSNNVNYDPNVGMTEWKGLDFTTVEKSTETLFDVWSELEGAPKICIFTGPGHEQRPNSDVIGNGTMAKKTQQIYDTFLKNPKYAKQYFYYEGKPLLMCYAATPAFFDTKEAPYSDDRFTLRWLTGYVGQQSTLFDEDTLASSFMWSWEERGAQTFSTLGKNAECMTVSASTRAQGSEGEPGYIPAAGRENGLTFRKQWARAQAIGVKIVLVVSWNEWTTAEQYSTEVSKDVEPSEIFGTLYLDILRNQIRIFKGKSI